jgi:hypothetical protein
MAALSSALAAEAAANEARSETIATDAQKRSGIMFFMGIWPSPE